jgi:F0F1-type ATP synthase membrane subunit b/b'
MFQFNLTLWVIFISFAIFIALMKLVFFDRIAWIKQQREQKLRQLHQQTDAYIAECQALDTSYQQELLLIKQEASKLFEARVKAAHLEHAAALQEAKVKREAALQEHTSMLQQWQQTTQEALHPHKAALQVAILKQLQLGDLVGDLASVRSV